MKNNGTKWDLSKSPEVVHAMIRDAFDIVAVVGVSAGDEHGFDKTAFTA
jgi:hypothetical protein